MARTAIVNPRRRAKRKANKRRRSYGRKRNTATASSSDRSYNKRRRSSKRRRNPSPAASIYSAGGYRRKNPDLFDLENITDKLPACTAGVMLTRYALKMAGPFEMDATTKRAVPGIKHAIACVLAAHFGSGIVSSMLGASKGPLAEAAAIGFAGDMFARTRLLDSSEWAQQNLFLGDDEAPAEEYQEGVNGFEQASALGAGGYVVGPDGTLYQMSGYAPDPAMAGFEQQSALGSAFSAASPSGESGFGYA